MITAEADDSGLRKKLNGLIEELRAVGATDAIIRPTKVLYELCVLKGRKVLLAALPQGKVDAVKREMIPYVEAAIEGSREGWESRAARAYRRWAYRFIEELYVAVRDNRVWGTTDPKTQAVKPYDKGGKVPAESFGVRHTRPDWRRVQKGQALTGKNRPDVSGTESGEPAIQVLINGQEIAR